MKIVLACKKNISEECLGHEIHQTRCIIIDMLINKFIEKSDIIVTKKDRKFLYELIFEKVLDIDEYRKMNNKNYEIIDISNHTVNCEYKEVIHSGFKKTVPFYNEEFKNLMLKINYCETDYDEQNKTDYVIVHHRYNDSYDNLKRVLDYVTNLYDDINIIVFTNSDAVTKNTFASNIFFTNNLQKYASYLHGSKYKCKLFISEWSGGGQISQYCYNGNILYYFNKYADKYYITAKDKLIEASLAYDYFTAWDFKNPIGANILLFENLTSLIANSVEK